MKFKRIDIGRQGNFILALLLIHFVFFGYLCNIYKKEIGGSIIFLHEVMFNPASFFAPIILFIIIFILVFREPFYEYGLRNAIWTIPIIILESWIWYWFIYGFTFDLIIYYFTRIQGYLTILSLVVVVLSASFVGAIAKVKYEEYTRLELES
ncbi:MAG: hypothetical protein EU541_05425 [Promethearchaeota archaeon]|nr:MAG: hypothetical protein EU541_05425 [Candidatus Lokiarchaeota archaeon]